MLGLFWVSCPQTNLEDSLEPLYSLYNRAGPGDTDLMVDSHYQGRGFTSELCFWLSKTCSKLFPPFVFLSVKWGQSFLNLQGVRRMKLTT